MENKCSNNFSKSRLQIKLKDGTFKTIPFTSEINQIIEKAHNGFENSVIKHNGSKATLRNISGPSMSIYWSNMSTEVQERIDSCKQCVQFQPIKQIKCYKPIIPDGPFDRFTADLWEIDKEMIKASKTQYRYVLTCVDHFSKFKWSELIQNKEGPTIAKKLEYFFNFFSPPKCFQTDNGKEFENSFVRNLCEKMNIKIIHGSPYYPSHKV